MVLALYMPETKGVPLESIEEAFRVGAVAPGGVLRGWAGQVKRLGSTMEGWWVGREGAGACARAADEGVELEEMSVRPVIAV